MGVGGCCEKFTIQIFSGLFFCVVVVFVVGLLLRIFMFTFFYHLVLVFFFWALSVGERNVHFSNEIKLKSFVFFVFLIVTMKYGKMINLFTRNLAKYLIKKVSS